MNFALRQLLKNPGFTLVAVLSLALGIAANTTIFSFVNALLLRPPPIEKPEELWQIWQLRPRASSEMKRFGVWAPAEISYLRENNRSFIGLGAFDSVPSSKSWNENGVGKPVQSLFVSGNFFQLCGIEPALGRFFLPTEDQTPGTHPVMVASYRFWKNQLASDPQAVGRHLVINGIALTVVGVAPETFTGTVAGMAPDLWVPFMMVPVVAHDPAWLTRTDSHSMIGIGRLRPGVTPAAATVDLTALTHRFQEQVKGKKAEDGAILTPSQMVAVPMRGMVRAFTATLMGAVFLVLLIACANAANLQLARGEARRQEMAVRSALGAARGRLIRQLLTESLLLALAGGALGLLLSVWLANLIIGLVPTSLPLRFNLSLDWRVLVFTAVVSLVTGIVFGLVPAFRSTGLTMASALKDDARSTSTRRSRFSNFLIVGQMSLCLVLLLAATLCLRSLFQARAFDPGFKVANRVTAQFNLNDFGYSQVQARTFYTQLATRMETSPGFRSVAWAKHLPLGVERSNGRFRLDTQPGESERSEAFEQLSVGPRYFATMGTALLQGREFTDADRDGAPRVAIVNAAAASRYWPGQNALGQRIYVGDGGAEHALEIVGVVQTGRYSSLGEDPKPAFFECLLQAIPMQAVFVAHVQSDPGLMLAALRKQTQAIDSRLAITGAGTLEQHLHFAFLPVRTSGLLLGVLGAVALVLSASGLFGVIAYSVSQRTREIGIRMALGAHRREVLRLVLAQGMKLAGVGVALGLVGAFATSQLLRNLLFGISPLDPLTFLSIPPLLLGVAFLACWLPAHRAARVNPIVALRAE